MWRRAAPGWYRCLSHHASGRTFLAKVCLKMSGEGEGGRERHGIPFGPSTPVAGDCVLLSGGHSHTSLHSTVFPLGGALYLVARISELVQDSSLGSSVRVPVVSC